MKHQKKARFEKRAGVRKTDRNVNFSRKLSMLQSAYSIWHRKKGLQKWRKITYLLKGAGKLEFPAVL